MTTPRVHKAFPIFLEKHQNKRFDQIWQRYLRHYFSSTVKVGELSEEQWLAYVDWRVSFWEKKKNEAAVYKTKNPKNRLPAVATIREEVLCLQAFLRYAQRQGWIQQVPETHALMEKFRRAGVVAQDTRGRFSEKNYERFVDYMSTYREDLDSETLRTAMEHQARKRHEIWREVRTPNKMDHLALVRLEVAVKTIAHSGIAVSELKKCVWGDVDVQSSEQGSVSVIRLRSEAAADGKKRVLYCTDGSESHRRLSELRRLLARAGGSVGPADLIFASQRDRKAIINLAAGMRQHLKKAQLWEDEHGRRRTLSSLRTFFVERCARENVPLRAVCENCGVSVEAIAKLYLEQSACGMKEWLLADEGTESTLRGAPGKELWRQRFW
jgi:hypothetical protein